MLAINRKKDIIVEEEKACLDWDAIGGGLDAGCQRWGQGRVFIFEDSSSL